MGPWIERIDKWPATHLEALAKRFLLTERGVLSVKDDRDVTGEDARR